MFPQTNESFIRANIEATLDRHFGETEEERAIREGSSYQTTSRLFSALHGLGHLFLRLGERLDHLGTAPSDATETQIAPRPATSHAH